MSYDVFRRAIWRGSTIPKGTIWFRALLHNMTSLPSGLRLLTILH